MNSYTDFIDSSKRHLSNIHNKVMRTVIVFATDKLYLIAPKVAEKFTLSHVSSKYLPHTYIWKNLYRAHGSPMRWGPYKPAFDLLMQRKQGDGKKLVRERLGQDFASSLGMDIFDLRHYGSSGSDQLTSLLSRWYSLINYAYIIPGVTPESLATTIIRQLDVHSHKSIQFNLLNIGAQEALMKPAIDLLLTESPDLKDLPTSFKFTVLGIESHLSNV